MTTSHHNHSGHSGNGHHGAHGHAHAHAHAHSHGHAGLFTGLALTAFTAAAGWYYLYGAHDAYKHRKQVKAWIFKLKAEVLEQISSLQELSKETYHATIDAVGKQYHGLPHVDLEELAAITERIKAHWDDVVAHLADSSHAK